MTKKYYIFSIFLGIVSSVVVLYIVRITLLWALAFLTLPLLSLGFSLILHRQYPSIWEEVHGRLKCIISFLAGYLLLWHGFNYASLLREEALLSFASAIQNLPLYLSGLIYAPIMAAIGTFFTNIPLALIASFVVTNGIKKLSTRIFIMMGLLIIYLLVGGIHPLHWTLPFL